VPDLERSALRHNVVLYEAQERDSELSGQRHDPDLSTAHALVAEALVPPVGELAVRLIAQPEPGQLDQHMASQFAASFVDTSIAIDLTAFVGTGRETDERGHVSSCRKCSMVDLSDENGCGRFADGAEHHQSPYLVGMRKGALCIGQRRFAIRFDVRDLPRDQVVTREDALNVAPKIRA
jgi:hypothetical protein